MSSSRLRNIKIQNCSARILSIEYVPRVLIQWDVAETNQDLSSLTFHVLRGESPEDMEELTPAGGIPANTLYEFVDYTAKLKTLTKVYYYKIEAREHRSNTVVQTFSCEPFTWDGDLDLTALYVVEEHLFAHKFVYGVPCFIYKKKQEGTKDDGEGGNFDPVLQKNIRSNDTRTLGTPYIGGYYSPIEAWMHFDPDPEIVKVPEWGEMEERQSNIQFTNYPLLSVGDIIVELKQFRFWRIRNVKFTEKNRVITLQLARVDEINRSDVEYHLPVPEEKRQEMLEILKDRIDTPEF